MRPRITVARDSASLAIQAADRVCEALSAAIGERGHANLVLTGGSSPTGLYGNLRRLPWRNCLDWGRVVLWMGDDRFVPSSDPNSNAGMARRLLFGNNTDHDPALPVPAVNVRFFPVDDAIARPDGMVWAAARYADELGAAVAGMPPVLDVVLLGLGGDGHILSVFPGSSALRPDASLVCPIPAPSHIEPHLPRLTLNPAIVPAARNVILIAQGGAKAMVVSAVLGEEFAPERIPGQLAAGENADWFLDEAAAAEIGEIALGRDHLV